MAVQPVARTISARIPTEAGEFRLYHYVGTDAKEHLALVMGEVFGAEDVLVRVHSECFTGDVIGSLRCDCGEQLHAAMHKIGAEGRGVIVYLRQEGRGIGLEQKLRAYNLQDEGYDTVDANLLLGHQADEREYSAAAAILRDLDIRSIRLMTNNPSKIAHLIELGVEINERVPLVPSVTAENAGYLRTKVQKMQHLLNLPATGNSEIPYHFSEHVQLQSRLRALREQADAYYDTHHIPFVTVSYAQALDGSIGTAEGRPVRISGPEALQITHALRATHDAILVGVGTILADDPLLTVRLVEGAQPQPVILDTRMRTPKTARILNHPRRPWIATAALVNAESHSLWSQNVDLIFLPRSQDGHVDLQELLVNLGARGIRHVMVEGGAAVISSFLRLRLANFAVITLSPRYLGGCRILVDRSEEANASLPRLLQPEHTSAGEDVILWGELELAQTMSAEIKTPRIGSL